MSLFDTLQNAVGNSALQQISARVGIPPDQLESVVGSLAPTLLPKLQAQAPQLPAAQPGGSMPEPGTEEAKQHGNSILASIFGSKEVSNSVAQQSADQTGVSVEKIKELLPQLASVTTGAMQGGQLGPAAGSLGDLLDEVRG